VKGDIRRSAAQHSAHGRREEGTRMYNTEKEREGGSDHIAVGMGMGITEMTIMKIAQHHCGEESSRRTQRQEVSRSLISKVG
jgi:hypothetical protein